MSLGDNRDYHTNEKRVNNNLNLHQEMMSRFLREGLSEEEASSKAAFYVMRTSSAYYESAAKAVAGGLREKDFLADVPTGLVKGARKAFRTAKTAELNKRG
jgi:hypothetical protein